MLLRLVLINNYFQQINLVSNYRSLQNIAQFSLIQYNGKKIHYHNICLPFKMSINIKGFPLNRWLLKDYENRPHDFVIKVNGTSHAVHRAILAAESNYLSGLFHVKDAPGQLQEFSFDMLDNESVETVLKYMYGSDIEVAKEQKPKIKEVASRWCLNDLQSQLDGNRGRFISMSYRN